MTASLTPATIGILKAKTAQSQADEMLAKGALRDKASRNQTGDTRDKDWQKKANVLPPGGGEAGRAFNAFNQALAAAVKANDPGRPPKVLHFWPLQSAPLEKRELLRVLTEQRP